MVLSHVENGRGNDREADLIRRAVARDESAIRAIIQANNRRLYRVARSIVRDDGAAEDVLQEGYLRAFAALPAFRGGSSLSTWLTRIVLNQALQHLRRRSEIPDSAIDPPQAQGEVIPFPLSGHPSIDPERAMAQRELCRLLERAIDELPEDFRTVLIARAIEEMSIEETAELLGLRAETVKTRLHRARRLLKAALAEHMDSLFGDVFPFQGKRCERLTNAVIKQLIPGSR
ncbi:RNA polymerase sigma factor [Hyphomicrobium sp.]|uniref:RNA polymerase sigma factor n=1 Tax=Hyphomicrobium sp. TaxID=82 RepID=UPI0025B92140|nr:RNA polymerase sigma factor [Hyphomicrobium sp.]